MEYLVRGNTSRLRPGMYFSDEPRIDIYGEMGVHHEDILFITEDGAKNMTRSTGSSEEPGLASAGRLLQEVCELDLYVLHANSGSST